MKEIIELSEAASASLDTLVGSNIRTSPERKKMLENLLNNWADDLAHFALLDGDLRYEHPCYHQHLKLIGGNTYECTVCGKTFEMNIPF